MMKIKNSFISCALVFSLFVNVVPSHAMMSMCEIEDQNAANVTIRCSATTRCSYTCPTNNEWESWKSNLAYAAGGLVLGLLLPHVPTLCNYVRLKWNEYWNEREVAGVIPRQTVPPTATNAAGGSSGDVSGLATDQES